MNMIEQGKIAAAIHIHIHNNPMMTELVCLGTSFFSHGYRYLMISVIDLIDRSSSHLMQNFRLK